MPSVLSIVADTAPVSSSARVILLCVIGLLLVTLGFLVAMALIMRKRPGAASVGAREVAVCPTCRRPFEPGTVFCPVDARRLVPVTRFDARDVGAVCAACRRGFEPGLRFCPHDASELVPAALFEATRRGDAAPIAPTGVLGKICPQCRSRHDLAHVFCGQDGVELVAIN